MDRSGSRMATCSTGPRVPSRCASPILRFWNWGRTWSALCGGFPGLTLPFIPGQEVAGVVEAAGDGTGVQPGERVYASLFPAGGGFAELALASADRLAPMPGQASFAEAAGLVIGGGTVHEGLVDRGRLQAGETVGQDRAADCSVTRAGGARSPPPRRASPRASPRRGRRRPRRLARVASTRSASSAAASARIRSATASPSSAARTTSGASAAISPRMRLADSSRPTKVRNQGSATPRRPLAPACVHFVAAGAGRDQPRGFLDLSAGGPPSKGEPYRGVGAIGGQAHRGQHRGGLAGALVAG